MAIHPVTGPAQNLGELVVGRQITSLARTSPRWNPTNPLNKDARLRGASTAGPRGSGFSLLVLRRVGYFPAAAAVSREINLERLYAKVGVLFGQLTTVG